MAEEWIVRVQGKEYGPVDVETLREWKTEGRLLPTNEARRADVDLWTTVADIPGLFESDDIGAGRLPQQASLQTRRSFAQILIETVRIYRKGFFQFVGLTLLTLLAFQVWLFGRFFINVLFWQQFAVLENARALDSLRESKNLARSGRDLPWFQRPMWRAAFIASIWFAFVLAITLGPEWSTLN